MLLSNPLSFNKCFFLFSLIDLLDRKHCTCEAEVLDCDEAAEKESGIFVLDDDLVLALVALDVILLCRGFIVDGSRHAVDIASQVRVVSIVKCYPAAGIVAVGVKDKLVSWMRETSVPLISYA